MRLLGIYGAGGCGRGIMPLARDRLVDGDRLVFIDDRIPGSEINGHAVLGFEEFRQTDADMKAIAVALAEPGLRAMVTRKCEAAGIGFFEVRAANVVEMDDVVIGEGAMLSPFVVLTSNIRIGCHFHANLHSIVEHDCVIGDFVTFAPGVRCNGNIHIADGAYIGSGAIIRQGAPGKPLRIGAGAVVGMGAVVLNDVEAGVTVVGNPARPLVR